MYKVPFYLGAPYLGFLLQQVLWRQVMFGPSIRMWAQQVNEQCCQPESIERTLFFSTFLPNILNSSDFLLLFTFFQIFFKRKSVFVFFSETRAKMMGISAKLNPIRKVSNVSQGKPTIPLLYPKNSKSWMVSSRYTLIYMYMDICMYGGLCVWVGGCGFWLVIYHNLRKNWYLVLEQVVLLNCLYGCSNLKNVDKKI